MPGALPLSPAASGLGGGSRAEAGDPGPWAGASAVPRRQPAGFRLPGKVLIGEGRGCNSDCQGHSCVSSSGWSTRPADRGSVDHRQLWRAEPGLSSQDQGLTFCVCHRRSLRTVLPLLGSVWESSQPWCLPEPWSFLKVHGRVWFAQGCRLAGLTRHKEHRRT